MRTGDMAGELRVEVASGQRPKILSGPVQGRLVPERRVTIAGTLDRVEIGGVELSITTA